MARPASVHPTPREIHLLGLLWANGPATVRDLHERFGRRPKPAYTSLQTNLNAMLQKGLVERSLQDRSHVYTAAVSREQIERQVMADVVQRIFDGDTVRLVATALITKGADEQELDRLQALIDEARQHD